MMDDVFVLYCATIRLAVHVVTQERWGGEGGAWVSKHTKIDCSVEAMVIGNYQCCN